MATLFISLFQEKKAGKKKERKVFRKIKTARTMKKRFSFFWNAISLK